MVSEKEVVAALPHGSFLRDYVKFAAGCTDAHVAFHVGVGLALLTQTIPSDVTLPFGANLYPNLYVLLVGDSTESRKSQSIKIGRLVLEESGGMAGENPGSWEGLVDALRERPQQVILYSEFGNLLANSEHGYLLPLKTKLTEVYDCAPVGRRTVGSRAKGLVEVKHPRLSLLAGCAPGYLERHTEEVDWRDGYLARFLTFQTTRARTYGRPRIDPAGQKQLALRLREYAGDWEREGSKALFDDNVRAIKPCAGMTPRADAIWDEWMAHNTAMLRSGDVPEITRAAVGRAPAMAVKIAGLIAWDLQPEARGGWEWHITDDALEAAIKIIAWHVDSVVRIGEGVANSQDMRDRRSVLAVIKADPTPQGEVLRRAKILKRRAMDILATLLEEGTIAVVPGPEGAQGLFYQRTALAPSFV